MAFCLEAGEPISDGIIRILTEQADLIVYNLTCPEIERDIGVHESRKTCKRIRATLRLVRDEIGKPLYRQENIRFRDIARQLAAARDSWVLVTTLDELITENADQHPAVSFEGLRQFLFDQYQTTLIRERADETLVPGILEDLGAASTQIAQLPIHSQGFEVLKGGLRRVYRRGRRAMKQSYAEPVPEHFHDWRKRVKYLWHQVEILTPIQPEVLTPFGEELHTLSDYLGDDHDLAVLGEVARENPQVFTNEDSQQILLNWIEGMRLELESQAMSLGSQLYAQRPKDFIGMLETYFQNWLNGG